MLTVDPSQRITAREALLHPWVLQDDTTLSSHTLESSKKELRRYLARQKFRAGVRSVSSSCSSSGGGGG